MDHGQAFGATFREVEERLHEGQPARVVAAARVYPTDRDDLWNALTDAERLPRWFLPITGDLRVGGRYQLQGNVGGSITRCDAPEALDVTWEYGGQLSWVTVRLTPEGDGTRLSLEHITPRGEDSDAFWSQYGPGATGVGWDLSFIAMALHIESGGQPIDRDENDAWMASADGKALMRRCADAWGEAHIAGGANADEARAMASRTADFYTGA